MSDRYIVTAPRYQNGNIVGVPSIRNIICVVVFISLILKIKSDNEVPYDAFQSSLNFSVDPCFDFYNFSCGLWAERHPVPEFEYQVTTFSVLQDSVNKKTRNIFENTRVQQHLPFAVNNAIAFYDLCIDLNRTKNADADVLIDYLRRMGGWPILNRSMWNEDLFDWLAASAFLIKNLDVHSVVGVSLTDDDQINGSVIYLKPPDLPQRDDNTLTYATDMLHVMLYELNCTSSPLRTVVDLRNLKIVEARWFKLFDNYKKREPMYMSVGELMQQVPEINWLNYLQLILNDTISEFNETIALNSTVIVENLDYLKKVADAMSSDTFSKEELANLFGWFVVRDIWILIPGVFKKYSSIFDTDSVLQERTVRNKCYELVSSSFSYSLDYLYIKNSSVVGIQETKIFTKYVKSAFKDILQKSYWLDEVSKKSLLSKLNTVEDVIGFPKYMNNEKEFDKMYKNIPAVSENILKYYFEIQRFYGRLRNLHAKLKFHSWILPRSVIDVRAYYVVQKNALVVPISLHSPPFYYLQAPAYLNFGAIGSVTGHEIMHGFDIYESMRSGITNAFSNASSNLFKKRADCFIDQYDKYDNTGMYKNNGTSTLRENIADTEGLHIAFEAYKLFVKEFGHSIKYKPLKNFTPDQMFFVSYGTVWCSQIRPEMKKFNIDSHSFPDLRVNNAVSNSQFFAEAFNCPRGSAMNPHKKCSIW